MNFASSNGSRQGLERMLGAVTTSREAQTVFVALVAAAMLMLAILGPAQSAGAQSEPSYTMTDLGTLPGGNRSSAADINASGQVVGESWNDSDYLRYAALYENGQAKNLGILPDDSSSSASGIDGQGRVVGYSQASNGGSRAVLYENGEVKDLGTLGGFFNYANGINASGQVVGSSHNASGFSRAVLYENGEVKDLGALSSDFSSSASSINDQGQAVGYSDSSEYCDDMMMCFYSYHAVLYENGQVKDLGTLGGDNSFATSINASGQVVGESENASSEHRAFLYENGQMRDLGVLPGDGNRSFAADINASGQVVGSASAGDNTFGYFEHAVLYENGQVKDLNDLVPAGSNWRLQRATAINDEGQIVANGYKDGQTRAFLLAPPETTPPDATTPGAVTNLSATPGDTRIDLSWTNPTDSDFSAVRVLRSESGPATSPDPSSDQTQVYEGTATSHSDTNLTNGTTYHYTAFAKDASGNWSGTASTSAAPAVPDTTKPTVNHTWPADGDTGLDVYDLDYWGVEAGFSEEMDQATVNTDTFTLEKNNADGSSEAVTGTTVEYDAEVDVWTLYPDALLEEGVSYTATVKGGPDGAKDKAGNELDAADYYWSFETASSADVVAPSVTYAWPEADSSDVSVADIQYYGVEAEFSEAMDPASFSSETFYLTEEGSTTPVSATVEYYDPYVMGFLYPDAELKEATKYTATVKGGESGAKDEAGNALSEDYTWSFTTLDETPPPPPVFTAPANNSYNKTGIVTLSGTAEKGSTVEIYEGETFKGEGVANTTTGAWSITVGSSTAKVADGKHTYTAYATDAAGNASEASAARTIIVDKTAPAAPLIKAPATATSYSTTGSVTISGSAEANSTVTIYDGTVSKGTVKASSTGAWSKAITGLANGTKHTYTAKSTDAAGNTSAASVARTVVVDTVKPTVPVVSPVNGTVNVLNSSNVVATFSEPMQAGSLTTATVKLVKSGTTTAVPATVTYKAPTATTKAQVILNPTANLTAGAKYTATISTGAKDAAGNPMAAAKVWSFTVKR